MKVGMAGDDAPSDLFRSLIGRSGGKMYLGEGAWSNAPSPSANMSSSKVSNLKYPISHGVVTNWDEMEHIYHHAYSLLHKSSDQHPVISSDHSLTPLSNRLKMTEIMFETFSTPHFYVANKGVLSVYASGRSSAICLQMGDGVCSTFPVYEGYSIPEAHLRLDFGGRDLTDFMVRMLNKRGYGFSSSRFREIAREIKETVGRVPLNLDVESRQGGNARSLALTPGGLPIEIDQERLLVGEALFNPSLLGEDSVGALGVHQLLYNALQKCDLETRRDFYGNLLVSGGATMMDGFTQRLQEEIARLIPSSMKSRVVAPPERKYSVWIGGSILASLSTFQSMWMSKSEYEEDGAIIVKRKCF